MLKHLNVHSLRLWTMLHSHLTKTEPQTKKQDIKVFYRSTMTSAWKIEEQVIRSIVRRNCKTTDDEKHLKIHIYYKSPKTSSLVMQNNLSRSTATLKQTNILLAI